MWYVKEDGAGVFRLFPSELRNKEVLPHEASGQVSLFGGSPSAASGRRSVSLAQRLFCRRLLSGIHAGVYPALCSLSHLCFFLVQFLSVVLAPIPSNITALVGGVMFGTWLSFFLTFAAVLLGSLLVFVLARNLGQSFVNRVVGERVSAKYLDVIHAKTDVFLVLAFLFPFFPDDLLCILAGLTSISLRRFFFIALLTRPWGLLFASALGGASFSIPVWGMALIGVAGAALFLLGMKYGDRVEASILRALRRDDL